MRWHCGRHPLPLPPVSFTHYGNTQLYLRKSQALHSHVHTSVVAKFKLKMAQPQPQPQPGQIQVSAPDPAVLAAIDAQYRPVPLKLGGDDGKSMALCAAHSLEVCKECGLDFLMLNQIAKTLQSFPPSMPIPPPPNVVHPQRSPLVQKAKDEGNVCFVFL
jgi:hypothetical protein